MKIELNGEKQVFPHESGAMTVAGLVEEMGLVGRPIAVARNGEVVVRGSYESTFLHTGDKIEFVHAVGGG